MKNRIALMMSATLLLAACGTAPRHAGGGGGYLPGDGPGNVDMAKLQASHDAVPRDEPLHRFANRPYEAQGVHYVPLPRTRHYRERGWASWYGVKFQGQRTSSGEVYDMYAMSAAHKTLPIPSYARVTNLRNHKSIIVRINDRGPFVRDRIIDLSYAAAYKLDIVKNGSEEVEVESIEPGQDQPAAAPAPAETEPAEPVQVQALPPATLPPAPATPASARTAVPAPPAAAPAAATPGDKALPATAPATSEADGGSFYVQLGSFHSKYGAEEFMTRMRRKVTDSGKTLSQSRSGRLTRVRLGPYRSAEEARAAAAKLGPRLGVKPFVSTR